MENSAFDYVTNALAVGGFVLGVVNYITELFRHRPHVDAAVRSVFIRHAGRTVGKLLVIKAINRGETRVLITQAGFELPDKRFIPVLPSEDVEARKLPKFVEAGESIDIIIPGYVFEEREIDEVTRGFVKTGTEKMIYTRRMTEKLTDLVRGHMNVNYS